METTLELEELDRELALKPASGFFGACIKVKYNKTSCTFTNSIDKSDITFKKRKHKDDSICITTTRKEEIIERCDLGHTHVKETKHNVHDWFELSWDQFDAFIQWFHDGTYSQVLKKEPTHLKVMRENLAFLESIQKLESSKLFAVEIKRLKSKIQDHL